jgi:predicted nucleic acid-binding protein
VSLVVSDSGPVHYLVLCDAIEVIPQLFGKLVLPASVARELFERQTPPEVRAWIQALPHWASLANPRQIDSAANLGLGEREAIALACELKATHLLVDDRAARRIATQRGLLIAGTVGILDKAAELDLLSLPDTLQKLLRTNFRIDAEVIRQALERDLARRNRGGSHPRK